MNIKEKINVAMVEVKREGKEFNAILLGKKEMEEINKFCDYEDDGFDYEDDDLDNSWSVDLILMDKESFCKAVYIVDRKKEEKKLFDELTT